MRVRILNLIDVLLVTHAEQIHWLNQQPAVGRTIDPSVSWLHRLVDGRLNHDLRFPNGVLPVFLARGDAARARRQKQLEEALENRRGAPGEDRSEIADYVSGKRDTEEVGVLVQHWCGRLFSPEYRNDRETYEAGRLIAGWPASPPWRMFRDKKSGRFARAKETIAAAAKGDLHFIHATSIGMENIAKSVRKLRSAAQRLDKRTLSAEDALRECLTVPPALLRVCSAELTAPFLKRPLTKRSVIVFLTARAYAASGDLDVAFMGQEWSACPARRVVPEMLRAVWHSANQEEVEDKRLFATINSWSRLWHRAAS
jgi:hypothetical protein